MHFLSLVLLYIKHCRNIVRFVNLFADAVFFVNLFTILFAVLFADYCFVCCFVCWCVANITQKSEALLKELCVFLLIQSFVNSKSSCFWEFLQTADFQKSLQVRKYWHIFMFCVSWGMLLSLINIHICTYTQKKMKIIYSNFFSLTSV